MLENPEEPINDRDFHASHALHIDRQGTDNIERSRFLLSDLMVLVGFSAFSGWCFTRGPR
jgi:hypothetical protein